MAARDDVRAGRSCASSRSSSPSSTSATRSSRSLRRMRAVELPDGIEREIIVVDDGSTDGTRDVLRQLGDSTVRDRAARREPGQGRGAAHRVRARHRRVRARAGRRPRVRPRRLAEAAEPGAAGPGPRRLRLAVHRRAAQHVAAALDREPVPLDDHERALQHDALRHGDVLQAHRSRPHRRDEAPVEPLRHRGRDHAPRS